MSESVPWENKAVRWKGLLFLAVVAVVVIVLNLIFTDRWLERRLEGMGTSLVGAKVEIDNLDFSFVGLHLRWDSLQVTNPKATMKNILTTGRTEFNLDLKALLQKKVVIENVQMTSVTSGTDRTTDGRVPRREKPKEPSKPNIITKTIDRMAQQVTESATWNLDELGKKMNVDSLIALLDLQSPQRIDSLRSVLEGRYAHWDSLFAAVNWRRDLDFFETRLTAVRPDEIRSLEDLEEALRTVRQARAKFDSLQKAITETGSRLKNDLRSSADGVMLADDWIRQDIRGALDKAQLPEFNRESIARMLFGDQVLAQAEGALSTINTVRSYAEKLQSDKPKKEKPPRFKGQTIHFVAPKVYPNFWLKSLRLSGHTARGFNIEGSVKDIVSQQKIIGRPTVMQIDARRRDGASARFFGVLNYLTSPRESFRLEIGRMPLQGVELSKLRLLPQRIASGSGRLMLSLELSENEVNGEFYFVAEPLEFAFEAAPEKRWEQVVRRVISAADKLDLRVRLRSDEARTVFALNSNLDDLFARELKAMAGEEVEKAKARIESYVNGKVKQGRAQLETLVNAKTASLQAEYASLETLLNDRGRLFEEKQRQLQERIEEEKKKGRQRLEDEAKKRLKGIGR